MYVDKVVEDLQFVRDNYKQGAKDKAGYYCSSGKFTKKYRPSTSQKPRNLRQAFSGNKASIYYLDSYYLCLLALT